MVIVGRSRRPFVRGSAAFAELDGLDLAEAATTEALARSDVGPSVAAATVGTLHLRPA